jgi:hypothetical protein
MTADERHRRGTDGTAQDGNAVSDSESASTTFALALWEERLHSFSVQDEVP